MQRSILYCGFVLTTERDADMEGWRVIVKDRTGLSLHDEAVMVSQFDAEREGRGQCERRDQQNG